MEAKVVENFFPNLVTAISDHIHSVSDHCLAKGLITNTVYKTVLQSSGTNDDKARTLMVSVLSIIEADHADSSTCFGLLLTILNETLPPQSKGILSAMKKELTEISYTYKAMVPRGQTRAVPSATELSRRCVTQQDSLVGRLEDSIRQHERACAEKNRLEEDLKSKSQENEKLKNELEVLKCQTTPLYLLSATESRLSGSEAEIKELKRRIEEVESVIEDHGMKLKRGKSRMSMEMKALFEQLAELAHNEIAALRRREEEQASLLAEREEQLKMTLQKKDEELLTLTRAKDEELRKKEEEYKTRLEETIQKEKSEHTIVLKEQEVKHKITLNEAEAKHQKALDGRETEIQERVLEKIQMREMQHIMELQDKDLKIKDLELKNTEHQPATTRKLRAKKRKFKWTFKRKKNNSQPEEDTISLGYDPLATYSGLPIQDQKQDQYSSRSWTPPSSQRDEKYAPYSSHSLTPPPLPSSRKDKKYDQYSSHSLTPPPSQKDRKYDPYSLTPPPSQTDKAYDPYSLTPTAIDDGEKHNIYSTIDEVLGLTRLTAQSQDHSITSSQTYDSTLYNVEASQPEGDDMTLDPSLNSKVTAVYILL